MKTLTANVLGQGFGFEASHVRKIRSKAAKKPMRPHRRSAPNEDETAAVVAFMNNGYRTNNYVTHRDVLMFIETNLGKCLAYQWMASFLKSDDDNSGGQMSAALRNMDHWSPPS
jgi:hypothetical protein